jgi:hypothetical protein
MECGTDAARAAQKKALAVSEAALIPTIDSESARAAGDDRQRKLQAHRPFGHRPAEKCSARRRRAFRVLSGE